MKAQLPCAECKGKCCTFPAMTLREFKDIRKKYGLPKGSKVVEFEQLEGVLVNKRGIMPIKDDGVCAYLSPEGRCSVYEIRPKVCQQYGEIPELPCQYLYPLQAQSRAKSLLKIGKGEYEI